MLFSNALGAPLAMLVIMTDCPVPCGAAHSDFTVYCGLRNERYADSRPILISYVVHAEEANEQSFLFCTRISKRTPNFPFLLSQSA